MNVAHLRSLTVDADRSPAAMLNYQVAKTIERSGGNPSGVLELLETVIRERSWEKVRDGVGNLYTSFLAFAEASRDDNGLGTTKDALVKLVDVPHQLEATEWRERGPALRKAIRSLLAGEIPKAEPPGRPRKDRATVVNRPTRDTAGAITARLKRDDPELAERVVAGEVSANAAAREKGWHKPRVLLTSPASVARKLREHFTAEQLAELIGLLLAEGGGDP